MPKNNKKQKTPHTKNLRLFENILISIFFLFVFFFTLIKISGDDDIFWHLETGRYIAENKTVPSSDVFGFASYGMEWIPFEWGWDVISYLLFSVFGYSGISVLRILIFLAVFFLYFRLVSRLRLNVLIASFLFILLLVGMMDRLITKPQIISYLFFSALIYIFISLQTFNREKINTLYLLPLIFLIWCNMHMGVLAGTGIFTIFVLSELAIYLKPENFRPSSKPLPKNDFTKLVIIYVLCLIVLLANPHGFKTYVYVYSHLNMKMLEDVFEWYSPFNKAFSGTIYQYLYFFFLVTALIVIYYSCKTKNLFIGLASLVILVFSVTSSRYTIDFMLIISILAVISLSRLINLSRLENFRTSHLVLSVLLLFFIISIPNNNLYRYINYRRSFGFGISSSDYPVKLFDFIEANNIQNIGSRPFNSFNSGGYFIWKFNGTRNFIDSRNIDDKIYYDYQAINNKLAGFEKKIDEFGFDYFIWFYPGLVNNSIELQTSVTSYLINNSQNWKLIYWDDQSMLFVRNEDKFRDLISRYEYRFVNPLYYIYQREPLKKALTENKDIVIREIQRKYKDEPDGSFINSMVHSFKVTVTR
ncbi:MAG: hypothetical protein L0Y79_08620 [Chlorobi bacterium]|nr:hypothetical protein [Chlorobiota bacterium]MCI0715979.1 hypothetical protein [Chlorobiota bacterium]